jgi:hypothetical protein
MIYENYMYFSNAQQTCAYTPKLDVFGKVYSGYTLVIANGRTTTETKEF